MLKINTEQLSAINAAVANVQRAFHDKSDVPAGALSKYAGAAGLRSMNVFDSDGRRFISVNNGLLQIDVGPAVGPVQPSDPVAGAGEVEKILKAA